MPENNAITKEDLQLAISKAVAELTNVIHVAVGERAAVTEVKLTAEMDKRFQSADRQRRAFREEVENRFHEISRNDSE